MTITRIKIKHRCAFPGLRRGMGLTASDRTLTAAEEPCPHGRDRPGAGRAVRQPPGPATLPTPFEGQAPREPLSPRPCAQSEEPGLPPAPLRACSPTGSTLPARSRRGVQMQTAFSQGQNQRTAVLTRVQLQTVCLGGDARRRQGRQPGGRVSVGPGPPGASWVLVR